MGYLTDSVSKSQTLQIVTKEGLKDSGHQLMVTFA